MKLVGGARRPPYTQVDPQLIDLSSVEIVVEEQNR